jgi:hypothetical protein
MRAVHVLPVWRLIGGRGDAATLVFGYAPPARPPAAHAQMLRLSPVATTVGAAVEALDSDHCIFDDGGLARLLPLLDRASLCAVRVDGPIEPYDALAIDRAAAAGHSPLDVEIRASAYMRVVDDECVTLHVRDKSHALALVAENMRHYLAALTGRPLSGFDAPPLWQVERVLGITGEISVRGLETALYTTWIDVGVSTRRSGEPERPAERSLIYDLPSDTWHDEQ